MKKPPLVRGARCRLSEVAIEHVNPLGVPAQAMSAPDEGALRELTVEMLAHWLGARLADVDHRLPFEMPGSDFHLAQMQVGVHRSSPQSVVGWADGPATVARRRSEPCGRAAADCLRDVPTADRGQSGRCARAAVPLGLDGLASLLTPLLAWWMSCTTRSNCSTASTERGVGLRSLGSNAKLVAPTGTRRSTCGRSQTTQQRPRSAR